ncbi:hypothetical protein ACHWQZ_G002719 [Mnemiopsis leidyi]
MKVFNYDNGDYRALNEDLSNVNWDRAFSCNNSCGAWNIFRNILGQLCERRIPKKTIRSQFQPPWYDSDCDRIRRKKEKWRIKAKEATNEQDCETFTERFRSARKLFKKTLNDKLKLNFVDDSDPALISKRFWTHVKSRSKSTRIPETVKYCNRFRSDPKDQANLFNEFFYNQFSEASNYNIDIDFVNNDFLDLQFHSEDIFKILKMMNANKAAGPDGIHGKVLKNCARSLAYPLSILFNLSFVTGCIPQDWKLASVVPVFKKGDKSSVENYRPISLTSLVMKVFKRCIKTALFSVCEDVLDPRQQGFLNNRSCVTQMVPFLHDLATNLNDKTRSDIIYFDFAKAFDSVSHDLILKKLKENFKVDGLMLRFIRAYLEGREQQVVIGGHTSSKLPVRSGVPQGSILGPLLFVLFINDMFSSVTADTNIALYADDTKIWRRINQFSDHYILQNDINNLFDWSVRNKMVFHPSKCKALSVTMQRNALDNLPFNVFYYEINGTCIDYVDSQKDLGVMINTNLTWGPHYNIALNKHSVTKAQMAEFLFTAVYLLDHCCLPLMSSATSQIETLQEEKISDQKTIINLQQDLISKKNEELGEVSKTVEAGLKTYSSALQQSCTTALSPRNIAAAVKTVTQEEGRSRELVLFGVTEESEDRVTSVVTKVLEQMNEKPQVMQCRRIGKPNAAATRPIIFSVRSSDVAHQILKKAKLLRDIEGYKTVYISPNRTQEERVARQKLVCKLKEKRKGDPNSRYFIRKDEIVQVALEESFRSTA